MDLKKFRLEKKWWQAAGKYTIKDSNGNLAFQSSSLGFFKTGVKLQDLENGHIITVKSSNIWNTDYSIIKDDQPLAELKKISKLSSKEYRLYTDAGEIQIIAKNWGKQIFFSKEGRDLAHASAKGSMWSDIGVVVHEGEEEVLFLATVVTICFLKTNGYA